MLLYLEGMAKVGGAFSRPPSSIFTIDDDGEQVAKPNIDTDVHAHIPIPMSPRAPSDRLVKSPAMSKHSGLPGAAGRVGSAFGGSRHDGSIAKGVGDDDEDGRSNEQVGQRSRAPSNVGINVSATIYFRGDRRLDC